MNIRLVIVDNHPILRLGLQGFLETDKEIQVVGIAVNGLEGTQKVRELRPDVVIMDLMMPVMDGFEATTIIKQEVPGVRVLILTSSNWKDAFTKAMLAGADGYFIKGRDVDTLHQAVRGAG